MMPSASSPSASAAQADGALFSKLRTTAIMQIAALVLSLIGRFTTDSALLLGLAVAALAATIVQVGLLNDVRREKPPRDRLYNALVRSLLGYAVGGMIGVHHGIRTIQGSPDIKSAGVGAAIIGLVFLTHVVGLVVLLVSTRQRVALANNAMLALPLVHSVAGTIATLLGLLFFLPAWFGRESFFDGLGAICVGIAVIGAAIVQAQVMKPYLIMPPPTATTPSS